MNAVAVPKREKEETQFWIPLAFVSRHWNRTERSARQWCSDGTFKEFGYDTYRDTQNRWWIGLSERDVAGWARGLPVIRDVRLHQRLSGVSAIYFLTDLEFVKIGCSKNILSHVANIQISVPRRLFLVGLKRGGESETQKIHKELQPYWHFSDYFRMDEPVCLWINKNTKTPDDFFRPYRNRQS